MSEFIKRRMEEKDCNLLPVINQICHLSPWNERSFLNELNNILADYIVLEYNDQIIGYAGMWCVIDEAQIMNIAVIPEFQRKKNGLSLMEELIGIAEKKCCTSMTLEVKASNIPAIGLYQSLGFKVYNLRKKYYHDGCDALLMKKNLNKQRENIL